MAAVMENLSGFGDLLTWAFYAFIFVTLFLLTIFVFSTQRKTQKCLQEMKAQTKWIKSQAISTRKIHERLEAVTHKLGGVEGEKEGKAEDKPLRWDEIKIR